MQKIEQTKSNCESQLLGLLDGIETNPCGLISLKNVEQIKKYSRSNLELTQ